MADVILRGRFIAPSEGGTLPALYLPSVRVAFGFDSQYEAGGPIRSDFLKHDLVGIVDSGADGCVIDSQTASSLGLKKARSTEITRAGSKAVVDFYYGQLFLPDINYVMTGEFPASDFRSSGSTFDALLGMDLLRRFDIHLNRKEDLILLRYIGE